jgi:DNA polymerase
MSNTHSSFLKEMGITQWTSIDGQQEVLAEPSTQNRPPRANWWFFGNPAQGDAQVLFENVIRILGLSPQEWSWKSTSENLSQLALPSNGMPVVVIAFGGSTAQKITGERDALPQLRETVLALNSGNDEEIPVIATFDLAQILAKPQDKALFWQDLLLAKSVLQNI